ncbi:hypothetical protein [Mesorhizobium sp. ES1-1]|uniref:hypothetical protein n=1 Tax=Mesorhizobium sp. ES1-1 TaxID=2876629 RepID=UPI001CCB5528|nr:hypothetical protein [Mesorhizobium sp. ES1-1]MBZ9674192.1 hypothetical protein [Mesorhizobium sp. ES1-1]
MFLRILLGVTAAASTGGVQASSLVFPAAPSSTPSIVALSPMGLAKTRDVVALGEPDVTYEKVAAVPAAPEAPARHVFMPAPVIIRGGVVGGNATVPTQGAAPAAATAPATASADSPPEAQTNPNEPATSQEPAPPVQPTKRTVGTK